MAPKIQQRIDNTFFRGEDGAKNWLFWPQIACVILENEDSVHPPSINCKVRSEAVAQKCLEKFHEIYTKILPFLVEKKTPYCRCFRLSFTNIFRPPSEVAVRRSSTNRLFFKKLTGKNLCRSLFLNKVAD